MNEPSTNNNSPIVRKSNQLIHARYGNISPIEQKYFAMLISQVSDEDEDYKTYDISIKELNELSGSNSQDLFSRAEEITEKILTRVINIPEKDGVVKVSPISYAKHMKGKGIIKLKFDPILKPYLVDLKKNYTSYKLLYALKLRSTHSIRMYELLKSHAWKIKENKGATKVKFELDELKEMLSVQGKYKSYNLFKTRVLEHARKELTENCDLTFTFREIKTGRRVTSIEFTLVVIEIIDTEALPEDGASIIDKLTHYGVAENQARTFAEEKPAEYLEAIIKYAVKQDHKKKINNMGAYIAKLIRDNAQVAPSDYEKKKTDKAKGIIKEQKAKQDSIAQEDIQIELWVTEFERLKKSEIDKIRSKFTDKDLEDLAEFCRANTLLAGRLFTHGEFDPTKDETMYNTALNMFAVSKSRFSDSETAFIDWALSTKGVHLKKDLQRTGNYRIEAHQHALFNE